MNIWFIQNLYFCFKHFNITSTSRNDIYVSLRSLKIQFLCYKFAFFQFIWNPFKFYVFSKSWPWKGMRIFLYVLYYLNYLCNFSLRTRISFCSVQFSHLSRVWLFATLWTGAHQAPLPGILQVKILKWVAMPSPKGSSWPRNLIHISYVFCISRWVLYH